MEKIVIVGSANTDLIVRADRIPSPGETVLGGEFRIVSGGKGANQAVAVARLGGDALFVARIGTDLFGDELMARYTAEKMDTSHVVRDSQAPTGVALITVDNSAENCIVVAPGANARLSRKDIDDVRPELAKAGYLLIQLEIPLETVEYAIQTAAELGVRVILNPAPAAQIDEKYLKYVYLLTPNESECALLTGRPVLNGTDAAAAPEEPVAKARRESPPRMEREGGASRSGDAVEQGGEERDRHLRFARRAREKCRYLHGGARMPCFGSRYDRGGRRFQRGADRGAGGRLAALGRCALCNARRRPLGDPHRGAKLDPDAL